MTAFVLLGVAVGIAAGALASWPLWRARQYSSAVLASLFGPALAIGVYFLTSNFDSAKPTTAPNATEMLANLEEHLRSNPNDAQGWSTLGRAYMQMERPADARTAYARAYSLAGQDDPILMLDYAEAMAYADQSTLSGPAGQLIENALTLSPAHPRALWYGGLAAAAVGNNELAATRWESMLTPEVPADIRSILENRIAAMRGVSLPAGDSERTVIRTRIEVAETLAASVAGSATLYLIAATGTGGPPLAVARYPATDIPAEFELSDDDAMIPGRTLGSAGTLRLTARISQSGEPLATPGDIYTTRDVELPLSGPLSLVLDRVVAE